MIYSKESVELRAAVQIRLSSLWLRAYGLWLRVYLRLLP